MSKVPLYESGLFLIIKVPLCQARQDMRSEVVRAQTVSSDVSHFSSSRRL